MAVSRRSEHARLAVLEAAGDLLAERGFADLTIEGIAARVGQAQHAPAVAARFEAEIIAWQRDRIPFQRALQRGDLAGDTDIDLAIDQLAGPVCYRVLITSKDVPPSFTEALVNRYLANAAGSCSHRD